MGLLAWIPCFLLARCVGASAATATLFDWLKKRGGAASVRVEVTQDLRGLVASKGKGADVGDVLLEVPLTATLSDSYGGDMLPQGPPEWCRQLGGNVQLALCLLQCRRQPAWAPFIRSWPSEVTRLPKDLDDEELEEVQDERFETEAGSIYFWLAERYFEVCDAHASAVTSDELPTEDDFNWAMANVWSRSIRLEAGVHGTRRLLVPVLDLANHEAIPSALFAYSDCGSAVRLHAVRPLRAGDAVTITYGEHPSSHFAMYYGFVPQRNPFDYFLVDLVDILRASGLSPAGWPQACLRAGCRTESLPVYAAAPTDELLRALRVAYAADDEAGTELALRAILCFCEALEGGFLSTCKEDEHRLRSEDALSCRYYVLLELRLARKRLVQRLRRNVAELLADQPAPSRLRGRLAELQEKANPQVYPALERLAEGEGVVKRWAGLAWDWAAGKYRAQ